jgi:hypothetical protein
MRPSFFEGWARNVEEGEHREAVNAACQILSDYREKLSEPISVWKRLVEVDVIRKLDNRDLEKLAEWYRRRSHKEIGKWRTFVEEVHSRALPLHQ